MIPAERILSDLGSDTLAPTPEFFAAAASDPRVLAALRDLAARAVRDPRALRRDERNRVSWAPYVFAENGSPEIAAAFFELGDHPEDRTAPLLGEYAEHDLPCLLLRLAGARVHEVFGRWVQTYRGAPEFRAAPLLAGGAAWAHGLISRERALVPLREELSRMADEAYADAQDETWLDTLLDVVLELHPAGLDEELDELAEHWGLEGDWEDELAEAATETESQARARLRDTFPRLATVADFVSRWERIAAES